MSNPNPRLASTRWFLCISLATLAIYGAWLAPRITIAAGGSDSSGYLHSGRLLAAGRLQGDMRIPPELGPLTDRLERFRYQPWGFIAPEHEARLTPTYPTGLPLHFALAGSVLGWELGPRVVMLVASLGAIALCHAVGREFGLSRWFAATGAVIFALSPMFLFAALQPLSDVPAAAWCLAAMWAAFRAQRDVRWALGTGVALAMAVLVRPTNLFLLPALMVLLGLRWRPWLLTVAGALPGALWLAGYNYVLYGHPLRSGYPAIYASFGAEYVPEVTWHFVRWLAVFVPAILLLLPIATLIHRESRTRQLLALGLWFAGIAGVYLFYGASDDSWTFLRFLLPAFPPLIIAALLGLEAIAGAMSVLAAQRLRWVALVGLLAWTVAGSQYWNRHLGVFYVPQYEQAYTDACLAARNQIAKDAVIVCGYLSGAVYYYLDCPFVRWDHLKPADFANLSTRARAAGRSIYALIFDVEEQAALHEHCPGTWTRVSQVGNIVLWRAEPAEAAK